MNLRNTIFLCCFFTGYLGSYAQIKKQDTLKVSSVNDKKLVRKTTMMSACLPGLGQAYNRKYWKIPIIYTTAGGLAYVFAVNNSSYQKYRNALLYRYDNNSLTIDPYPDYSDNNLVTLKKQYKRWRDLSVIGLSAVYLLNIIDANVDAHLKGFNKQLNEDLGFQCMPYALYYTYNSGLSGGLKFKLTF